MIQLLSLSFFCLSIKDSLYIQVRAGALPNAVHRLANTALVLRLDFGQQSLDALGQGTQCAWLEGTGDLCLSE